MSSYAKFIPYALDAAGSLMGSSASKANAAALREQARVAQAQGFADEEQQRREARQLLGMQAAAMAEGGSGYGGTNEMLMRQSATLAELDALNIRYRGLMAGQGLLAQASAEDRGAKTGNLMAGASLLRGYAAYKYR